jgi:hypothetical protein
MSSQKIKMAEDTYSTQVRDKSHALIYLDFFLTPRSAELPNGSFQGRHF